MDTPPISRKKGTREEPIQTDYRVGQMGGVVSVRIFGHYVSLPLVLLMLAEAAIHVGAVYLAGTLRFLDMHFVIYSPGGDYGWLLPRSLLYALVMLGVMTAFGLYGSALHKDDREYEVRFLASYPAGALVMVIIFYVIPASFLGRGIMALSFLFSLILTALARVVFFRIVGGETLKRRVLVLGSGSRAAEVEALLSRLGSRAGFHLVGFVLCGDEQPGRDKSKLLGDCNALRSLVEQNRIDEIVVGVRDRRNGHFPMSKLLECKLEGTSIVDLPTFFERETGYVQLNSLSASWMVFSEGFSKTGFQKLLKRAFDISVSGAMLVATLPIMLVAALAIWLETGRPILYRQKRVGESGQVFEIFKFRSMRVDAEKDGVARWAKKNDDRITRVGKLHELRRPASGTPTLRARTEPESALLRKQALREAGYHGLGTGPLSLRSVGGRRRAEAAIRSLLREEQLPVPRSGYSLANCTGCFVWP